MSARSLRSRIANRAKEEAAAARICGVEKGLLPGHRDYTRFVVVSGIRSGSTMLTSLLDQHPNARTFFELFHIHRGAIPFDVTGYRRRSHEPSAIAARDEDPAYFLRRYVWTPMPRDIRAVGFKLLHTQGRSGPEWWDEPEFADWWSHVDNDARHRWFGARSDLWKTLAEDRTLRVILLERKNLLRAAVSAVLAKSTGRWGDGASGGYASSDGVQVTLPTGTLLRDFAAARRSRLEAEETFREHARLALTYEELSDRPDAVGGVVQSFLGLPPSPLAPKTRKQAVRPYSEVVRNWREVCELLKDTEWRSFIEE